MDGHRRKIVAVSIATIASLTIGANPLIVSATLSLYVVWWMYRYGRTKKS
jgi:hypothetical protein